MLVDREEEALANELFDNRHRAIRMRTSEILRIDSLLSVTVYDRDGQIVEHADRLQGEGPQLASEREEQTHAPRSFRVYWRKVPAFAYERAILAIGEPIGFVSLRYSLTEIEKERRIFYFAFAALLGTMLVAMLLALNRLLAVAVRRPILALHEAMGKVRSEGPGAVIEAKSGDELGDLTRAFNRMSAQLREVLEKLRIEVAERREAEKALRESEKRFRELLDQAGDGIFVARIDGRMISVNDQACKTLGYSRDELLEMKATRLGWNLEPERRMDDLFRELDSETPALVEGTLRRKDGEEIPVEVRIGKIDHEDHQVILGLVRDVTERHRADLEQRRLEAQLLQAQKLEAIGTLAGGIAHDFNNILSAILGYTEIALQGEISSLDLRYSLEQIHLAGTRARDLVAQILAFSRQSTEGKRPLRIQPLVKETANLLSQFGPLFHRNQTRRRSLLPRSPGPARPNPSGFDESGDQRLPGHAGICQSPSQHHRDCVLTLRLRERFLPASGDSIPLGLPPGPYAELSVSDTGPGIDPGMRERIFDPYFTTKDKAKGTGLGLSIVLSVVKSHGGEIVVESEIGEGTMFRIYLPIYIGRKPPPLRFLRRAKSREARRAFCWWTTKMRFSTWGYARWSASAIG
jgi:PAS domain S-box-containing protein